MSGTRFTGTFFLPDYPGFDQAAVGRVFNGRRPGCRPAAVLIAANESDIAEGVNLASERGWQVAVRSGGHSWGAWSVRPGSLLIDLGSFKEIDYAAATGIVSATTSIKGGDELDPFLAERGRFFNGGHCPSVGIGGFLLQGGQGWNCRGWGWAAESIVAIDVVTADGELLRADAADNSDLYWAARGGGPAFPGVVTRYHLQTRERFKHVGFSLQLYPVELFDEVMTWMYSIHASVSPDVEIVVVSMTPPAEGGEHRRRVIAVTGVALVCTPEEAGAALAPFMTCPVLGQALVVADAEATTLAERKVDQARMNPEHARYVVDNAWLDGDPAQVIDAIRPLFVDLPGEEAFSIWFSMAPLRALPDMALSLQTEAYVASYFVHHDAAKDQANREWLNWAYERAEPVTAGQYLGDSDMTNRQLRFLGENNWRRLLSIIAARDPQSRFVHYLCADPASLNRNHWQA